MSKRNTTSDGRTLVYLVEDSEQWGRKCRTYTVLMAQLVPIEREIADTLRTNYYGNEATAQTVRARYCEMRERGVSHTVSYSRPEIELKYTAANESGDDWYGVNIGMPRSIEQIHDAHAVLTRLEKYMTKTRSAWDAWNSPDALKLALVKFGAVRAHRIATRDGYTERVTVWDGLDEPKPREPAEYSLTMSESAAAE